VAVIFLHRLLGQGHEVGAYGGHADGFAVLHHASVFQGLRLVFPWIAPWCWSEASRS
jgi:hypothetical protein